MIIFEFKMCGACSCNCTGEGGMCTEGGCCKKYLPCCTCVNEKKFGGGIPQTKSNTDCFCLIIYLVLLSIWLFGMMYGFTYGDVRNIGQPYDQDGNACGKGAFEKFPVLFFNTWVTNPNAVTSTVCLSECPSEEAQVVQCHINNAFSNCNEVKTYPTTTFLNRFCMATRNKKRLASMIGKPVSILNANASSIADVKANA